MIKQASFVTSIAKKDNIPNYNAPEIAFAGKSNVGKSSLLNYLCNQNKLAKTSQEPGRTRLINYFEINKGQFYFVDLPGYGFAKAPKGEVSKWGELIEGYFAVSQNLKNVFLLVDIRHQPTDDDRMLLKFLYHYNIPLTVIATKADKLSKMQQSKTVSIIASELGVGIQNVFVVSASNKIGKEKIFERIEQILQN